MVNEPGYVTDVITDESLRQLQKYVDRGYPFYLSVHYTAPHAPWINQHPQNLLDSYDNCPFESCPQEPRHPWMLEHRIAPQSYEALGNRKALKGYFASVTALDQGVGRILDRIDELGLRQSTLIMFLSDNGFSCGHHGFWGKGNATNPRNMYENSIRMPAIFSHLDRIPQGRVEDVMISAYDFMPTLLEYLDLPVPVDRNLPGRSFLPILEGKPFEDRDNIVIYDEYGPVRMVRTRQWKYIYRHAHGPHELFGLANDPDERQNISQQPDQQDQIDELHRLMDEWFAQYVDPVKDGLRQGVTAYGQMR